MPPKKEKGAGAKGAKGPKSPKQTPGGLADANARMSSELETARAEVAATNLKWQAVGNELLGSLDEKWKAEHKVGDDPATLTEEAWKEVVGEIVVKRRIHEVSVERMVEQLELRVTELSVEFARVTQKCHAYEQGLDHLLTCCDLDHIRGKVHTLKVIAGEAYHGCEANDPTCDPAEMFKVCGVTDRGGQDARRVLADANALDLRPPCYRGPGETPLLKMAPNLLLYIIKELSVEKASGADWRTLGQRLGLHQSMLDEWGASGGVLRPCCPPEGAPCCCANGVPCSPAGLVLMEWLKLCPKASVRLLHRHLSAAPMRCTLLCRRIADFYDVC